MNRKLIIFAAALAVTVSSAAAIAQAPSPKQSGRAVGPTVSANKVGIRAPSVATTNAKAAAAADTHLGAGQNVALMVVGAAAIIVGAIIGETAGILLAVTGAAIGLYGLYNFIQ